MGGPFLAQGGGDTNVSINGGLGAFLALFVIALAIWALGWSMTRHLRRVSYLEKQHAGMRPGESPRVIHTVEDRVPGQQSTARRDSIPAADDPAEGAEPTEDPTPRGGHGA
ncbi:MULTISPECIES: hypothetical protein [Kytococcus]|uniref:Uncharacterized protein n=1 Tax=Kytococcus schroeteri TaxID=138300 RepID=A0A2I1P8N8_9MICO|nr:MULTISPECIES: hypothetical protein [Kytococcus]OFS14329.1 hypothetical protein HMPREF3099_04310 [Kytococcus sp. HMSC28H12]PKZ40971.1 hypothetical protein CYJ76_10265 [Kytococcus schroeteri]